MADPIELERHLTIDGTEDDVAQLEAREALDEIGVLRCEITDRAGHDGGDPQAPRGPDPAALIGKTLVLKLSRKEGSQERQIVGYVVEAESSTTRGDSETGTLV